MLAVAGAVASPSLAADLATPPASAVSTRQIILTDAERAGYRTAFAAIHARDWASAAAALDALPGGPLTNVARAELLLAGGAPAADPTQIAALLTAAPELPEAPALSRLATARGATQLPLLPATRDLVHMAGAPKRQAARPTRSDAAAAALARLATPAIKANDGVAAEALVEAAAAQLSPDMLSEWRQRVAWAYLLANDDADARRVATMARSGDGDWAVQADWVLGLAAWRMGDMGAAADAFSAVAARARDSETIAAGLFWAARSDMGAGHPDRVAPRLRSASRLSETFYGMLASATLGLSEGLAFAPPLDDVTAVLRRPNARAAAALIEIGEIDLADKLLRQQARIGLASEHNALLRLAGQLDLPATQIWLAQNGPAGTAAPTSARYPMPAWQPTGGWRVDRALCLAHALQESQFRNDAVSRAGARGLMQLMPGTMRLVARHKGEPAPIERLADPAVNFEYGQSYLEELAMHGGTGGLLPKVIAAYNAGPNNVAAWNLRPGASNDPLFFIETIPFAETRAYVAIVLRNYWMYQCESGAASPSLTAMAQGKWPRFPSAAAMRTAALDKAPAGTQ